MNIDPYDSMLLLGLIYLSGGNPRFLARTLRGTRVWDAVEAAWRVVDPVLKADAGIPVTRYDRATWGADSSSLLPRQS